MPEPIQQTQFTDMKKLFLVDAYALIFKYYYAFLGRPMRNRTGMNTSVVFGFVKFLRDIQKRERPDLLGVAFDPPGGSFRREIFPEYKANRTETPEDILLSVPYVKRVLEAMCIPILEVEGYEADDVIGTLSQKGAEAGYDVYMVTPDKDYGQLVREHCRNYKQRGADGSIEIVGREEIREKYGIDDPQLVRDILALWGDASDNIPGVPGIGEKSACKLVREWGTVENILENVGRIPGKQGEKIAGWADNLRLAKRLTTIRLDVPIELREEDLTVCEPHLDDLRALFRLILHEQVFYGQPQGGTYILRGASSMTIQQYPAPLAHGNGEACPPVIMGGAPCCPLAVTAFHTVQTVEKFVDGQSISPPRILASAAA